MLRQFEIARAVQIRPYNAIAFFCSNICFCFLFFLFIHWANRVGFLLLVLGLQLYSDLFYSSKVSIIGR